MDEEQQSGEKSLTVGDIFRMVKKRLAIVLVACLAFTLVCVLLLVFLINPSLTTYSIGFRLMFPTRDTAAYPDGSPFFYQDIISEEYLKEAQAASPDFSTIKIDSMVREDGVSVTVFEDEEGISLPEGPYTLRMEGNYFLDAAQAESFCRTLISVAVSKIQRAAREVNYSVDRNVFDGAPFAERLRLLEEQRDAILNQYDYWIGIYSEAYRVVAQRDETNGTDGNSGTQENTVTLGNRRAQVVALYGESIQQELENELDLGGYYSGDLEAYKERLKLEYGQNKTEIEEINKALSGASAGSGVSLAGWTEAIPYSSIASSDATLSQRLSTLITRNNRISHWLDLENGEANPTLTEENNEKFAARLGEEYEKLCNASDKLTMAIAAIYTQGTSVLFEEQSVAAEGGINAVLGAVLAFVLSFAAACAIVCAVERSRARAAGVKKR